MKKIIALGLVAIMLASAVVLVVSCEDTSISCPSGGKCAMNDAGDDFKDFCDEEKYLENPTADDAQRVQKCSMAVVSGGKCPC
jgi:hypothetical protein